MNDFLFELGCEELPAGAVLPLAETLYNEIQSKLNQANLDYEDCSFFATPRRIAIYIKALQAEQPSQPIKKRGPAIADAYDREGQPKPALLGFAKSCGVGIERLKKLSTDKGEWIFYEDILPGKTVQALLPSIIAQILEKLPITKPMRWGDTEIEFARPVHWAVMLYGSEILDCQILGLRTSNLSYGHRFHHPQALKITSPQTYEEQLSQVKVMARFNLRKENIRQQIQELALKKGALAIIPEELLTEVTAIVEWPEALLGSFDEQFLTVPAEALIAAMQGHQKCFALENKQGMLLPYFITISNINSKAPQVVIAGNEKVMRARLSDAAFFFAQDKKQALSHYLAPTAKIIFQAKLGTVLEKSQRLQSLMTQLAQALHLNKSLAARAAELSKCDLVSSMVGEFPELQGTMGYYYALASGEDPAVALAIKEAYWPRFAADIMPSSPLGLALSLSDRLDTLVGIFAIGEKPSGEKDPYKLRRHALAIVRLLISLTIPLDLSWLIQQARESYGSLLPVEADKNLQELKPFILERLQSYYLGQNISLDIIQAARTRQEDNILDLHARILALVDFIKLPEAKNLAMVSKRVKNILAQVEPKELTEIPMREMLLEKGAERLLYDKISTLKQALRPLYQERAYEKILSQLASLNEPLSRFFEQVMVMVEDQALRANRLCLLQQLQDLQEVADISLLQL